MANIEGKVFAGLDIGGTTIKSILVDSTGQQVGDLVEVRSRVTDGYRATYIQLDESLALLAAGIGADLGTISGVGLDVPAPSSNGVIWSRANLAQDWVGRNIRNEYSNRLGVPVFMTNDGNAAALGEYAARIDHTGSLLLVAPGTGLGGGFVLPGGAIHEGANGLALEVGHMSVPFREESGDLPDCTCGWKGCAEAWVSLVALRRRLGIELGKEKWGDHPLNKGATTIEEKAFQLRNFAEKDDPLAVEMFRFQGFVLGYALADLVRLFDPGLVVISGGLAETSFKDQYMDWVQEGFVDRSWPVYRTSPLDSQIITTHFEWAVGGDSAAALGMAFAAREIFGGDLAE